MYTYKKMISAQLAALLTVSVASTAMAAQPDVKASKAKVISLWSQERRAQAIPRDLVVDERGLGYLRLPNGKLRPHGHSVAASNKDQLRGKPSGGGGGNGGGGSSSDTSPPVIDSVSPADGSTVSNAENVTFSANVTDVDSGVKSVSFNIGGRSIAGQQLASGTWQVITSLSGTGTLDWSVFAKDNAKKGGNSITSESYSLVVTSDSASEGELVIDSPWNNGGAVQTAAGRIYFYMPTDETQTNWAGYVCSGTVVTDTKTDRSVILTAAHCVYDDVNKVFARDVMFIPNQAGTTGSGSDRDCANDPIGCWVPKIGVIDHNWHLGTFPNNIEWDYAYYVVDDASFDGRTESLDEVAGSLPVNFLSPAFDVADRTDYSHALGYSYSDDPNFHYCAEDVSVNGSVNWWLDSCGLSGGSSGGPWIQPMDLDTGYGSVFSVNSWGYERQPGMAGPKLSDSSAECMFNAVNGWDIVPSEGVIISNCL